MGRRAHKDRLLQAWMAERAWSEEHDEQLKIAFVALQTADAGKPDWPSIAAHVSERFPDMPRTVMACKARRRRLMKYGQWIKSGTAQTPPPSDYVKLVTPVPEERIPMTEIRANGSYIQLWKNSGIALSIHLCEELKNQKEIVDACWTFAGEAREELR